MLFTTVWSTVTHITLAGIDMMWFFPWVLILYPSTRSAPLRILILLWFAQLLWMIIIDGLHKIFADERLVQSISIVFFIISTSLVIWRAIYASLPLWDPMWLGKMLLNLPSLDHGMRPETILFGICVWLWLRAGWTSRRSLMPHDIERNLKWGILLLLMGSEAANRIANVKLPITVAHLFVLCAVCAYVASLTEERNANAHSSASHLSKRRLMQIVSVFLIVTILAYVAENVLSSPLNKLVSLIVFSAELIAISLQITVIFGMIGTAKAGQWLGREFGVDIKSISGGMVMEQGDILAQLQQELATPGRDITLSPMLLNLLRYLPLLFVSGAVIIIFILLLRRVRIRRHRVSLEIEKQIPISARSFVNKGMDQLRNLAGMIRKYGVSQQLLNAISVQNIYANLGRIAKQNGYPRHRATPPEGYLHTLTRVFIGCDEELQRITNAYMTVHYGDITLQPLEIKAVQQDYNKIRRVFMQQQKR